jgi:hypothetical protein
MFTMRYNLILGFLFCGLILAQDETLEFSHEYHIDEEELSCADCHGNLITPSFDIQPFLKSIEVCTDCHDDELDEFIFGTSSHNSFWLQVHGGEVADFTGSQCSNCHTETSCDQCHTEINLVGNHHPNSYMLLHGLEAKMDTYNCSTCHSIENECRVCHSNEMVMPLNHSSSTWVNVNISSGSGHSNAVFNNPESCQVCHELTANDFTCSRCH